MLTELCQELKNWFTIDKFKGRFKIQNGVLTPSVDLIANQYYRIIGSRLNDGVHKYGDVSDVLADEPEFDGFVWTMGVPKAVIDLDAKVEEFITSSPITPYTSESFGGYSYEKGTTETGAGITWKEAFASELNRWRKI